MKVKSFTGQLLKYSRIVLQTDCLPVELCNWAFSGAESVSLAFPEQPVSFLTFRTSMCSVTVGFLS